MANQQRSTATKASILAAAAAAFAEQGYEATGVAQICTRAKVSKGAFYYHFESKQTVFLSLIDAWMQDLDHVLAKPDPETGTVPDHLHWMSRRFQDILISQTPQLALVMEFWTQASRDETMHQAVISSYRRFQQFFIDLVALGIAEGTLSPIDPVAGGQVLLSLTSGLFFQGLLDPAGADWGEVAEKYPDRAGQYEEGDMMNLITGATGHLGNVLARELVSRGERVRALLLPNDIHCPLDNLNVECVEGDVLDPESLESAMEGIDTVYHLAGIISILPGANPLMQRVNVEGVRNVAAAALNAGVDRFVHVSSVHAFQRMPQGTIVDESIPLAIENAAGTYDQTKAQGTLAILESVKRGLNAVIVCPSAIIGPYDFRGSLLGSTLVNYAKKRFHFLVPGAYDFVDVRDVAHGLTLARDQGRAGEIYILSGTYATLQEAKAVVQRAASVCSGHLVLPWRFAKGCAGVVQQIYRAAHIKPQFTLYALRTLQENALFSSKKARHELGFQTRSLLETARDMLTWKQSLSPA